MKLNQRTLMLIAIGLVLGYFLLPRITSKIAGG